MLQILKSFLQMKVVQTGLVSLVFVMGFLIRVYDLTDPPMDFHPARQYHSAVIARGLYTQWGGEYPAQQAQFNRAQESSEARIEPPLFEHLIAFTYLLVHSDALWIARLYAIFFWLAGGLPLFWLAKRIQGFETSLLALGVYLLLPYGVFASRSFQPDPLMVALIIFSLWALDRWQMQPTWRRALVVGVSMGAAILVKQVAVFFLFAAFLGLLWVKWGPRRAVLDRQTWVICGLALLPALTYNFYGVFISGSLAGQYSQRFFPALWLEPGFYLRWSSMIDQTVGLPLFLIAVVGLFLLRDRQQRGLALCFTGGYLVYGFTFAHHIGTHDYYQLPILPLAALGLGTAASCLFAELRKNNGLKWGMIVVVVVLLAAALLSLWEARSTLKNEDYRDEPVLLSRLTAEMGGPRVAAIGLMEDYGAALYYYAYFLPEYWWPEEHGRPLRDLTGNDLETVIRERMIDKDYFIVSDFDALRNQPAVQQYFDRHFEVFYADTRYLIYDLRQYRE